MKTKHLILAAALALGLAGITRAADAKDADARVQVAFDHPDKFTDIRDAYMPTDKGKAANLDGIRQYVEERAPRYLADGQKLEVTFTDIDLAGDFEPWHGAGADDVRIVKDIYPPRMDLSYKVTDAAGKVVKEGKRQLRDLAFMMNLSLRRDDPLRYEKELLDRWMRDDLKPGVTKN